MGYKNWQMHGRIPILGRRARAAPENFTPMGLYICIVKDLHRAKIYEAGINSHYSTLTRHPHSSALCNRNVHVARKTLGVGFRGIWSSEEFSLIFSLF